MKIVLDTNFIVSCLGFKIDIFGELRRVCDFRYELCVMSGTIGELERLINRGKLFERRLAKLALQLIAQKELKQLSSEGASVDEQILGLDPKSDIIATQDGALRKELKEKGFKLIGIRQKQHLALS